VRIILKRTRTCEERSPWFIVTLRALSWLLLVVVPGCDLPGKPVRADRPIASDKVVDFDLLYRQHCSGCHGADGKLGPAPPLNDDIFLMIVPDSVLSRVISEGRPGTPMPAFSNRRGGPVTDAQVKILATGIKPRWRSSDRLPEPVPPYLAVTESAAGDVDRGTIVFMRACAPCHGPLGGGTDNKYGGAGAINDPSFLALISNQTLRRYIITGRPDLGMPNCKDKTARSDDYQAMTNAEITDLVALLASWRQPNRVTSSTEP
jgi:cytochrome c oxidase cbb3-type subunit III